MHQERCIPSTVKREGKDLEQQILSVQMVDSPHDQTPGSAAPWYCSWSSPTVTELQQLQHQYLRVQMVDCKTNMIKSEYNEDVEVIMKVLRRRTKTQTNVDDLAGTTTNTPIQEEKQSVSLQNFIDTTVADMENKCEDQAVALKATERTEKSTDLVSSGKSAVRKGQEPASKGKGDKGNFGKGQSMWCTTTQWRRKQGQTSGNAQSDKGKKGNGAYECKGKTSTTEGKGLARYTANRGDSSKGNEQKPERRSAQKGMSPEVKGKGADGGTAQHNSGDMRYKGADKGGYDRHREATVEDAWSRWYTNTDNYHEH